MERTSYSILNKNVLNTLIKKFELKAMEESNFFRSHWWVGTTINSINLFINPKMSHDGINPYMDNYTIIVSSISSSKWEEEEIYIFEYEDVKKAIDKVNNFVKFHSAIAI